jgi:S-layer protein (TIGR01567 family)
MKRILILLIAVLIAVSTASAESETVKQVQVGTVVETPVEVTATPTPTSGSGGGGGAGGGGAGTSLEIRGEALDCGWYCWYPLNVPTSDLVYGETAGWDAYNFPGFWYDLDSGNMSEVLYTTESVTNLSNRMIGAGKLYYNTTRQIVKYEVNKTRGLGVEKALDASGVKQSTTGCCYVKLGWLGNEYVALNGNASKLSRLIIEQESGASEKKTLAVGESWDVGGDWALTVQAIDAKATPRHAQLVLRYNGVEMDNRTVYDGEVYTYVEPSIAGESDVPMFTTYIDSVFAGATSDMVQLRYTWAISKNVTTIHAGDTFGVFEVRSATSNTLRLSNKNNINLDRGSTLELAGDMKFKIADSDSIRFYPMVERTAPGVYEIRGDVVDCGAYCTAPLHIPNSTLVSGETAGWDAYNFPGFWYDLDDGNLSEVLYTTESAWNLNNRILGTDTLYYNTTRQIVRYEVSKTIGRGVEKALDSHGWKRITSGCCYAELGWFGEEYVAVNGNARKLSKLIIEQNHTQKKTLTVGESWNIGGWTLEIQAIDAKATPRQAWLVLKYNGTTVDDAVVVQGDVYTYVEPSIAGESDVPMFATYVDSVFAGATSDMVQLRYTWAVSREVLQIHAGDTFGLLQVRTATTNYLALNNRDTTIDLTRGSIIDVAEGLKFKVADSDDVRFYPFIERSIIPLPPPPPSGNTFIIPLRSGWNLVSLPLVPTDNGTENTSIEYVLSGLSGELERVVSYNASALEAGLPPWSEYIPGDSVNTTLWEMKTGVGYFVKMRSAGSLTITGERVYHNMPRSYPLVEGWNLFGYHSTSTIPVESVLLAVDGKYASLWMLEDGVWKSYVAGEFSNMKPGFGYWIYMTAPGEVPQV